MKKLIESRIKSNSKIMSAASTGTTYYHATLLDVIDAVKDSGDNAILYYLLSRDGFDCLNVERKMYGSYVDGEDIWMCSTDVHPITVDGEEVDPEEAMKQYGPDKLSDYIVEADDDVILKYITGYELNDFDIEDVAIDMLNDDFSFKDILLGLDDIGLIDDLL